MLDKILNIVKANPEIKDWVLNKTVVDKNEIYLIKNTIESTRTVNKTEYFLSVFVEVDDKQGTTNRTFSENISNEELEKQILEMVFVAKLALNKKYELPYFEENDTEYLAYDATVLENPGKALNLMKEMIFNVTNNEPNVQLASSEIFITCATSKNLSSRGFNHISKSTNIMLELVLLAGKGENQVESHLIRNERFISNFDLKALIKRYSDYAKNNISADTPKSGKYNVIFCEEALNNFFNYYVSQTSASSIYNKMSKFKVGDDIIKNAKGDKITLSSDPSLPGGLSTKKYDWQGLLLKPFTFIKDNKFVEINGNKRYCDYLNTKANGYVSNLVVNQGNKTYNELLDDNTIIVARFSEFSPNSVTGGFSGEIRNGFVCKNKQLTPIKGGSVSGMMDLAMQDVYLSKEQVQQGAYNGPKYIKVNNLDIAGK